MPKNKIRYLVLMRGIWRYRPSDDMKALGFRFLTFGPELTPEVLKRAIELNEEWDQVRRGRKEQAGPVYPPGSLGEAYVRIRSLKAKERAEKGFEMTLERRRRDDWPRAWKWIGPLFSDVAPSTVTTEQLFDLHTLVTQKVSPTEAHRVIKIWRAMWTLLPSFKYLPKGAADPSLAFANTAPPPRTGVWSDHEAKQLVQRAWRVGKRGLAAVMAVAWDTQLSPVDARTLKTSQMARDGQGAYFSLARAKTGRPAVGTLSRWSQAILNAYLKDLGVEMHDDAPIFRTAGSPPGPKGGRPWAPRPYTQDKLVKDFGLVRELVFGPDEKRQLQDMRRSGAVEATRGGAPAEQLSQKMANTLSASNRLQQVYNPVDVPTVRKVDAARESARREQKPKKSVTARSSGV
jgi:hypothetical protein